MEDDWDLQAVVRGCTTNSAAFCSSSNNITTTNASTTPATATTNTSCGGGNMSFLPPQQEEGEFGADMYFRNGGIEDLHELYKPFFPKKSSPPQSPIIIPISPLSVLQDLSQQMQMQMKHQHHLQQVLKPKNNISTAVPCTTKDTSNVNSRSKRRKNQMKRVIEVPAEALSSDMWSWRKYGQKPIKGSPYPRGYYKCSTSKGCLARKQVERNRSNPGIFIVTYTAEHNHPIPTHRNSLAGISRQKPATSSGGEPSNPCSSSPPVSPSVSFSSEQAADADKCLETESRCKDQILEEGEGNMNLEDDFFQGLEELEDVRAGVSDTFPQSGQLCWLTNNSMTTTTATGGV